MTRDDLIQRIASRVRQDLAMDHLIDPGAILTSVRTAIEQAVPVVQEAAFPGIALPAGAMQGRVRQPTGSASVNRGAAGGVRLRLDSDHDPEFWFEATIPADLLHQLGFVRLSDG